LMGNAPEWTLMHEICALDFRSLEFIAKRTGQRPCLGGCAYAAPL